jgi:nicotinamidase/pyrazinamidase
MEPELVSAVLALDDNIVIPKPKKKLVVFIDTQTDFMIEGSALYVNGAQSLISNLNNFAYHLNPAEIEAAIFTFDTHHFETYSSMPESEKFPIHCVYNTPGWENVVNPNIINNRISKYSLRKGVFDMWEESNIVVQKDNVFSDTEQLIDRDIFFEEMKSTGINTVVVVGVAADFCVKWAVDGFIKRGWNVEIPKNLTAGIVKNINEVVAESWNNNVKVV